MRTNLFWIIRGAAALACAAASVAPPARAGGAPTFEAYVTSGLSSPIGVMNPGDSSPRLFVVQQGGAVRVIRNDVLQGTAFLTINGATQCRRSPSVAPETIGFSTGSERGLLGLAFHPGYAGNGFVFVSFTDANGDSVVARFTNATPSSDTLVDASPTSCVMMLRVDQDGANHNGGNIVFGPDGFLYFGLGDGGGGGSTPDDFGGGDSCNRGQTLDPAGLVASNNCAADANFTAGGGNANSRALLGKMLRINVDLSTGPTAGSTLCGSAANGSANYSIPAGNPFAGADAANACDEVWSWGLRNPWRWSFDRDTDDLLIGDVGQNAIEEIDFEPPNNAGRNYGWNCFEGNVSNGCSPAPPNPIAPVITYGHSGGRCSITGGYRYRGPVTAATGNYYYADYCTGEVWLSTYDGNSWTPPGAPFVDFPATVPAFGEDQAGELYVVRGSQIWRLNGDRPGLPIFSNGFEDP